MARRFFYVRNHVNGIGSATGDGGVYSSVQTGDWDTTFTATTEYYNSIVACYTATTPPIAGDIIVLSDIHNHDYGANTNIQFVNNVIHLSVDDTEIDLEKDGAVERTSSGVFDLGLRIVQGATLITRGTHFISGDDLQVLDNSESSLIMKGGSLRTVGSGGSDRIWNNADGNFYRLTNTDIWLGETSGTLSNAIQIRFACHWEITGGKLQFTSNKPAVMFTGGGLGGGTIVMSGFDASNIKETGSICDIDASGDDIFNLIASNVLIPSGVLLNTETPTKPGQRFEAYSVGSADEYYNLEVQDYYGEAIVDTAIYRDNALTYDQTNKLSIKVSPVAANCIKGIAGLRFQIPLSKYLDLTTTKTIRVYLVINNTVSAATSIDHLDINVIVKHTDNTSGVLGVIVESSADSPLKTGTTLTTSSETWTGDHATNAKQYQIDVVIPALSNVTNGLVEVAVEVSADALGANDQIYVCPNWDVI